MPLETASYISQLVSTNPVHTDGLSAADSHMRLIKSVLQAQFPNFTAAALNSTQAQIDGLVTNGAAVLADAGAFFKTNTVVGMTSPSADEYYLKVGGNVLGLFSDLSAHFYGNLTVDGALTAASASVTGNATIGGDLTVTGSVTSAGAAIVPIGGSILWFTDTLPSGAGTYKWLNGAAISRTTFSTLFGMIGTTYGSGNGSTTFNLPDLRDSVPVGKGTMGGTGARGRITNADTSALNNQFGEDQHQLSSGEMPSHTHTGGGTTGGQSADHTHTYSKAGTSAMSATAGGGTPLSSLSTQNTSGTSNDHTHGFSFETDANGSDGAHNNVQPSTVCNWVMRVS